MLCSLMSLNYWLLYYTLKMQNLGVFPLKLVLAFLMYFSQCITLLIPYLYTVNFICAFSNISLMPCVAILQHSLFVIMDRQVCLCLVWLMWYLALLNLMLVMLDMIDLYTCMCLLNCNNKIVGVQCDSLFSKNGPTTPGSLQSLNTLWTKEPL